MDIVKVKSRNMLGIVQIRSKQLDYLGHRSFNNVVLEDGTIMMCRDDDWREYMIGQQKLKSKIDSYTLSTLPHSILLVGERGSEQDEVCEYISEKFNLPLYDITELISEEYINEIYSMPNFGLYVINSDKFSEVSTEKKQNILLKFFEEPNAYMYIVFVCSSKYNLLETIQTRSYELQMDLYSRDILLPMCTNNPELELKIASTPGMVEELNHIDIDGLKLLCENIVTRINVANYQNTLTIPSKINFKDEYDKYPLWAFIRMLGVVMLEKRSNLYWLVEKFSKKYNLLLDKKGYLENLLTELWVEARNGY